jgi:hypothetical protein
LKATLVAAVLLALLATGCAQQPSPSPTVTEQNVVGDIPDNQVFVPYTPADHGFTVDVPEGWARTTDGSAVVFTDKLNSVRIETMASAQAPTVRSATARFPHGTVSTAHRTGGDAVLVTYEQKSTPDPVTGKTIVESVERYEFWQGGVEVILSLSGPKGADNVDPWRTVTDSLRWT